MRLPCSCSCLHLWSLSCSDGVWQLLALAAGSSKAHCAAVHFLQSMGHAMPVQFVMLELTQVDISRKCLAAATRVRVCKPCMRWGGWREVMAMLHSLECHLSKYARQPAYSSFLLCGALSAAGSVLPACCNGLNVGRCHLCTHWTLACR